MLHPNTGKDFKVRVVAYSERSSEDLKEFCERASESDPRAGENISWKSLSYLLNTEQRFKTGEFFLLYVADQLVAFSGFHQSDFDKNTYLLGVRTYTSRPFQFKSLHSSVLLPLQFRLARSLGARQALMVFNRHNAKLFRYMKKSKRFFNDPELKDFQFRALPYMIDYKKTPQHALLVSFDPTYEYSFEKMRSCETNI